MKNRFKLSVRIISISTALSLLLGSFASWNLSANEAPSQTSTLREDVVLSLTDEGDGANFNVYYGDNADEEGLSPSTFAERFKLNSDHIQHNFDMSNITDWWSQMDDYMTTALYNGGQYRNFEMQIEYKGTLNKSGYAGPVLVFGVTDPAKWVTEEGGGFSVRNQNEGNSFISGFIDGVYTKMTDPNTSHPFSTRTETGYFVNQWDYWFMMKVRVEDNKATVTIDPMLNTSWGYPDEDWSYSYTYDLGSEYTGGYVGFAAPGQISKYRNFKLVDLGGEVTPPPEKYKNSLASAENMTDFDCYYADNAENGLGKVDDYTAYWEHKDGGVWRTDASTHRVSYNTSLYVSSLVLNTRQYKNFELTVKIKRTESGGYGYMYPMVVFGLTDPAKHYKYAGGGIAAFATAEGALCAMGDGIEYTAKNPTSGYSREGEHTLKITVKYGIATVEILGAANETLPDPVTFMLPEDYTGGYISLVGMANVCGFKDLSIKELLNADVQALYITDIKRPDTVETPTAVLGEELTLPETVSVTCDDGESYDVPVNWTFDNYDRFTRGEYEIGGTLESMRVDENRKRIMVGGVTAKMTVKVTGDKDLTPVKVACVGDSITYGDGVTRLDNYPNLLQKALGGKYIVENFGVNGTTLLSGGDSPYIYTDAYTDSKAFAPNIVVIMLGTNDSKSQNWVNKSEFVSDYKALIEEYQKLPSKPTVYIATSPSVTKSNYGITDAVVTGEIVPLQKQIAGESELKYIDINKLTRGKTAWFPDGIHPNGEACGYIAQEIADNIMLPEPLRSITLNKTNSYIIEGQSESFTVSYQPAVITETKDVIWTSSDESVATVKDGTVTAVKVGKAVITADCHGKTAAVTVEVYKADAEITVPLTSEEDMMAFDYYYTDDAANGYTRQYSYEPHWYISGSGTERTQATLGEMKWGNYNIASLLYNRQQYHNFELSVDIHRKDVGEWQYPMVVFGIKDPTKYISEENGGIAVFATAEGGLFVSGQVQGRENTWIGGGAPPDNSGYNRQGVHTLKIRVEYNTVTVTLTGEDGENLPEPITVELGDTDMDGYIALVGRANPCGFANFKIKALLDNDVEKITVEKVVEEPDAIEVEVGTLTDDIEFPETVKVKAGNGKTYDMPVSWDCDGYNRYYRGTYTLKGIFNDALFVEDRVKVLGGDSKAEIEVKVVGESDLVDDDTVCFDFNGISELEGFENYHSSTYGKPLEVCDPLSAWTIVDGKLQRLRSDNFTTLQTGGWTSEKSQTEIASLVYTGRKYKNFELNVDYKRGEGGFWWAMVGFAIEDPTKLITEENGGVAVYAEQEGRPIFWSEALNRSSTVTPYKSFGYTSWHHMKLVVKNGVATVYFDDLEPAFSAQIPNEYLDGGYISLMTNANTATYDNLSIKALPDDEASDENRFNSAAYPEIKYMGTEEIPGEGVSWSGSLRGTASGTSPSTGENLTLSIWAAVISLGFVLLTCCYKTKKTEDKL